MEVCVDVEVPLQQVQTQKPPKNLVIKISKAIVYNKRTISETMDIDVEQTAKKKMIIVETMQIVDLEDEGPRDQVNLNTVESATNIVEIEERSQLESEGNSRSFHSQKYYFDKAPNTTYQSRRPS